MAFSKKKPDSKLGVQPEWNGSVQPPNTRFPDRAQMRTISEHQSIKPEYNFRAEVLPTTYKDTIFVPKASKFQFDQSKLLKEHQKDRLVCPFSGFCWWKWCIGTWHLSHCSTTSALCHDLNFSSWDSLIFFWNTWSVCLFVGLSVSGLGIFACWSDLSVLSIVHPFVCPSVCPFVCPSAWMDGWMYGWTGCPCTSNLHNCTRYAPLWGCHMAKCFYPQLTSEIFKKTTTMKTFGMTGAQIGRQLRSNITCFFVKNCNHPAALRAAKGNLQSGYEFLPNWEKEIHVLWEWKFSKSFSSLFCQFLHTKGIALASKWVGWKCRCDFIVLYCQFRYVDKK